MASAKTAQKETIAPITLDAKGEVLGRLATQAAFFLQGKHRPDYQPNRDVAQEVIITNIAKVKVTGKKATDKVYYRHSGYMGGLYERTYEEQFELSPTEVVRKAVYGMLPDNRLRRDRMNRLKLEK